MKGIQFEGQSLEAIRDFPDPARQQAGFQLDRVQRGLNPIDWKPFVSIGKGVKEIRISDEGQFRVMYVASIGNKIFVLHAFAKKTQKTRQSDIDAAKRAYKYIIEKSKKDENKTITI